MIVVGCTDAAQFHNAVENFQKCSESVTFLNKEGKSYSVKKITSGEYHHFVFTPQTNPLLTSQTDFQGTITFCSIDDTETLKQATQLTWIEVVVTSSLFKRFCQEVAQAASKKKTEIPLEGDLKKEKETTLASSKPSSMSTFSKKIDERLREQVKVYKEWLLQGEKEISELGEDICSEMALSLDRGDNEYVYFLSELSDDAFIYLISHATSDLLDRITKETSDEYKALVSIEIGRRSSLTLESLKQD